MKSANEQPTAADHLEEFERVRSDVHDVLAALKQSCEELSASVRRIHCEEITPTMFAAVQRALVRYAENLSNGMDEVCRASDAVTDMVIGALAEVDSHSGIEQ